MTQIYINLEFSKEQAIINISKGFIKFPKEMYPKNWLNNKQFVCSNEELDEYVNFFRDQEANIYFRRSKEEDWTPITYQEFYYDDSDKNLYVRMVGEAYVKPKKFTFNLKNA